MPSAWDFTALANAADPRASAPEQHLWLARLFEWLRHAPRSSQPAEATAPEPAAPAAAAGLAATTTTAIATTPWPVRRLRLLASQLAQHSDLRERVQGLVEASLRRADLAALFSDFGFADRPTLGGELLARVQARCLPATPDTTDGATA